MKDFNFFFYLREYIIKIVSNCIQVVAQFVEYLTRVRIFFLSFNFNFNYKIKESLLTQTKRIARVENAMKFLVYLNTVIT